MMSGGLWVPLPAREGTPRVELPGGASARPKLCQTFWGSHGCSLPPGHEGYHTCGVADDEDDDLCSQHRNTEAGGEIRWWTCPDDEGEPEHWGVWMESYPSFGEDSGNG
jgi:hypothetical protein